MGSPFDLSNIAANMKICSWSRLSLFVVGATDETWARVHMEVVMPISSRLHVCVPLCSRSMRVADQNANSNVATLSEMYQILLLDYPDPNAKDPGARGYAF